jgi:hypothetical protein
MEKTDWLWLLSSAALKQTHTHSLREMAQYHQHCAEDCEASAREQSALIAKQIRNGEEYPDRLAGLSTGTSSDGPAEMMRQCESIAASAARVRDQLLELARWHRAKAAECVDR